ncbi:MAG: hypothetical protein ABI388_10210 [Bacteroidia bacterium]
MTKKFHYLLLVLFIVSAKLFAQNNKTALLVKEEASLKITSFLNLIPEGRENEYGFANRSDFSNVKIEEPYQIYYVSLTNDKLIFNPAGWRVPVSVNNKYVTLLTVQFTNGKAEAVDFGGNVLAQKIEEFEKLNPTNANQRVIIRNTFLKHDYITTNYSLLCNNKKGVDFINNASAQYIYQLNEAQPIKTAIGSFYDDTINFIKATTK